ncbi:uncharacterized protein LOC127727125 [Mytilus californianus]|uniref:uncharacterized protein LOC127727125 n=1 Tax=Mytilus californianus TaxID=6549 RepID=UPI0022452346|nr:uncharacterized protein LOC127727125 [Mytilus californianus]XP_052090528.1 uncharacterized protein LOC127727125 [Mytilus californianus]
MEEHPFDLQAYEPPLSLWSLVEQHVSPYEQTEIKNMLGESLVDQSLELHAEIDTLLEIWRDYRYETDDMQPAKILPEPPGLRGRLIQEIQFFVDNVKEKAQNQGMNPDRVLNTKYNMDVIDYALDSSRPGTGRPGSARPCSAFSREGRDTPMITSPTGSDRASFASTLSEEIESMNDKLNYLKFDECVQHLRSTLEEENEILLRDIRFLYECIDDEAEFRAEKQGTVSREPTILDLQQERSKMEKELLNNTVVSVSKKGTGPRNIASIKKLGPIESPKIRIRNIDSPPVPIVTRDCESPKNPHELNITNSPRQGSPTILSSTSKNRPLKASHDIKLVNQSADNSISPGDRLKSGSGNQVRGRRNVMTMKEGINGAQIVTLGMPSDQGITHVPSPPPLLERPRSAQRFRKMVMDCRDT